MIRLRQIKLPVEDSNIDKIKYECAKKLKINLDKIRKIKIVKRSIDARNKPLIYYSYIVDLRVSGEKAIIYKNKHNKDVVLVDDKKYEFTSFGSKQLKLRPVIVGSGPCGLMAGYMLAKYGYKPIIIERGSDCDTRTLKVREFWKTGKLDINSNVQFGEGGAGTFSDGKLNTLIKDKNNYHELVFKIFVENGAPKEIMYDSKPHIGTDILKKVVKNIRNKIIEMGGSVRFNTKLTDILITDNKINSIIVNEKEKILCDVLVLAIGHSARDTFELLYQKGFKMEAKPFAVGIRIQHSQDMINKNQYGENNKMLEPASYKLTYKASNGRGVYTFCMCPGGYVVNASSNKFGLCINGMSNYKRESPNANSAVIVTVSPKDFGTNPLDGVQFQINLERKAYELGSGMIPISLYGDYKKSKISREFGNIKPVFKGKYIFKNLNEIFPSYVNEALKEGIDNFNKKIKGYASDDAIIAAVEARTSSPVKIIRSDIGEANYSGIYPSGEGCGYAGGITSAAIDGIATFEKIASIYKPLK